MSNFYNQASWVLVPSGIEEDIVFAQKPISGLGDLSFTRASDATYTDSTGVVRRSPYNLVTFSEDFSNVAWTKTNAGTGVLPLVTANQGTAPNGTLTADRVQLNRGAGGTVSDSSVVRQQVTVKNNEITTISIYLKSFDGNNYQIVFSNSGVAVSQKITVTSEWQRFFLTGVSATTIANIEIQLREGVFGITGQSVSADLLVWGAQLVEGTSALDYFPTTNRQDVPRIDFRNADGTLSSCGRLLLEPQRTNSIRNSSMVGAVAGSPGTLPTNWTATNGGLTQTITGIGTENGLPYIDLRYNGTATASSFDINFDAITQIAASNGQVWTASAYLKQVSNPNPVNSISYLIFEYTSAGVFLAAGALTLSVTSSLERFPFTRTLNGGATVGAVRSFFRFNLTNGAAYDFTIRIAAPQMELGNYATTWVPTTTAAVTRLADTFTRNNIFTNGLISAAGGTWFVEFDNNVAYTGGITQAQLLGLGNNTVGATADNIFFACSSGTRLRVWKQIAGTLSSVYLTTTDKTKLAIKWNGTTMDVFENGVKVVTATSFTPTALETLRTIATQHPYNISQSALAPTPLSDAECIQLTTL